MKLHFGSKDGGPESRVWMYGFEWKKVFSVLILRFENGSRDAYHSHAFNAVSWVLGPGSLVEFVIYGGVRGLRRSWRPVRTARECCHKVVSIGRTFVLSFRGPWTSTWIERVPNQQSPVVLTSGRQKVQSHE